jgi:hypothetical protein
MFPPYNAKVHMRRLDQNGAPAGTVIEVSTPGGEHTLSNIAVDSNGLVVVFWCADDPGGDRTGMFARWYDATGAPLTLEYDLGVPCGVVDMAPGGEFTVAWDIESGDTTSVYAQRFNAAGVPQGGTIPVTTAPVEWPAQPSVANFPGGSAIAWVRRDLAQSAGAIDARLFDTSGAPTTPVLTVTETGTLVARPDVAAVTSSDAAATSAFAAGVATANSIVIAWDQLDPSMASRVRLRRFDSAGVALGSETAVDNGIGGAAEADVVADPSAGFAVVWEQEYDASPSFWHIRARRFDGNGAGGPGIPVTPYVGPSGYRLSLSPRGAFTAGGNLQCVWMGFHTPSAGEGFEVYANTLPLVATAATPAPARAVALRAWPNPFQSSAVLEWSQPAAGEVALDVYDVRGRLVRHIATGRRESGPQSARWDGRDARGRAAPSGVYYARLRAGAGTAVRKIVRLR